MLLLKILKDYHLHLVLLLLVLFPFETEIYREAGVPVTYVGHPTADTIPLEVNKAAAAVLAVMDASRARGRIHASG